MLSWVTRTVFWIYWSKPQRLWIWANWRSYISFSDLLWRGNTRWFSRIVQLFEMYYKNVCPCCKKESCSILELSQHKLETIAITTKTANYLKLPKNICNHLQPPEATRNKSKVSYSMGWFWMVSGGCGCFAVLIVAVHIFWTTNFQVMLLCKSESTSYFEQSYIYQ